MLMHLVQKKNHLEQGTPGLFIYCSTGCLLAEILSQWCQKWH